MWKLSILSPKTEWLCHQYRTKQTCTVRLCTVSCSWTGGLTATVLCFVFLLFICCHDYKDNSTSQIMKKWTVDSCMKKMSKNTETAPWIFQNVCCLLSLLPPLQKKTKHTWIEYMNSMNSLKCRNDQIQLKKIIISWKRETAKLITDAWFIIYFFKI